MSCTRKQMIRETYYTLFLARAKDVNSSDERFDESIKTFSNINIERIVF